MNSIECFMKLNYLNNMATYQACPNCSGQKKGDTVKRCRKCSKVYCSTCTRSSWTSSCPNCKANEGETIGYIG